MARELKGGLYKGRDGVWHYHYKEKGKPHHGSTGCTSFTAAQEWLRMHRTGTAQRRVGIRTELSVPTLQKALDAWKIAQAGVVTEKYASQKEDRITNHFGPELHTPLHLLDTEILEKCRQRYLTGTWAGNGYTNKVEGRTVGGWNSLLRDLKALIGWAVKRELIDKVPFSMTSTKVQEEPEAKSVIWPELGPAFLAQVEQWPTTRHKYHQDTRTAVRMMLLLGLREDEAINSRWEWLDHHRNKTYTVGDAKNRRARVIPVPDVLLAYIEQHHTRPKNGSGLILPADDDGNPHREGLTTKCVQAASLAIGISGMTPHRVRATFATGHFESGTDLNQIQHLLGHENQSTTLGYIVTRHRDLAESQDRLAAILTGSHNGSQSGSQTVRTAKPKLVKSAANTGSARGRSPVS